MLRLLVVLFFIAATQWALAQVTANAGLDVTICSNEQVTLSGSGAGGQGPYTYAWTPTTGLSDPNVANPLCTVNSTTVYTLTVTDANMVQGTDNVTVTVNQAPNVVLSSPNAEQTTTYNGVTAFSLCQPGFPDFDFQFNDASTAQAGATYTIVWGNGTTDTPANSGWSDTENFPLGLTPGTYTIDEPGANGCTTVFPFNVFIGDVPLGGLSVVTGTSICTGQSVTFSWNDYENNPPGTSYIVEYGDGTSDVVPHPPIASFSHTYLVSSCTMAGGEFSVNWYIENPCDERTGTLNQIRVSESPVADFTMSPMDTVCWNTPVTFTDQSLGQQAANCNDPKHLWSISPGTYTPLSGSFGTTGNPPTNPALWATGTNVLTVEFDAPGTYTITDVTGNVCGLDTVVRTICVEQPPVPAFTAVPTPVCVNVPVNTDNTSTSPNSCLTIYEWDAVFVSPYCGSTGAWGWTGGSGPFSFEPGFTFSQPGVYQLRLEAENSCGTVLATQNITVAGPPEISIYPVGPICVGQTIYPTGVFQACGTPITGQLWTFNGGTPGSSTDQVPGAVTYNAFGNFNVELDVTSQCGPSDATAPLVVNAIPPSAVANAVQDTVCPGDVINLLANTIANATYQWSGPGGFSSTTEDPSLPNATAGMGGTYTVTAYFGICAGPSSTVNIVVLQGAALSITPSAPEICEGQSVTLTANGGAGYTWTTGGNPAGSGNSIVVSPSTTTTYDVTGNGAGCSGNASATVIVNDTTILNVDPIVIVCDQAIPVQLNANPTGGTWSGADIVNMTAGGLVTPIPGSLGPDVVTYSYTNADLCPSEASTTITVQAVTNPADAGTLPNVCEGSAPMVLNGTPAGGTWSAPVVGNTFDPNTADDYTLTYSTGTGTCATSDDVTFTVWDLPLVDAGTGFAVCENAIPVPLNNGVPAGGDWSGTGVSGGGPYTFDPSIAGSFQILTYAWIDVNLCQGTDTIHALVVPPPIAVTGPDTTLCDQSIAYPLIATPGGGTWSGGAPYVVGNVFTPVDDGFGVFTLTYTYTDAGGCTDDTTVTITVVDLSVIADAGMDDSLCVNAGSVQLQSVPASGAWTPTAALDATGLFDPVIAGVGQHFVEFCVGAGTCRNCDTRIVTVLAPPVVDAGVDNGFCVYEPVQDLFESPAGGAWSGSTAITDMANGLFDPAQATLGQNELYYEWTDPATGCSNTDTVMITVNEQPTAAFTNDPVACQNTLFTFTDLSTGNSTSTWNFGDDNLTYATPQHTYTTTGTFTVTLIVGTGANCTDTITGTVDVWPAPVIDFTVAADEGCGPLTVNFTNNSTGPAVTYDWNFGYGPGSAIQFPPAVTYPAGILSDTTYTVTLSGSNYCGTFQDDTLITVHPEPTAYFGPQFDTGCSPWPVTFSNVSVGEADSFLWIWGDGTTTTTTDSLVTHTFYADSVTITNTVTLIATNACGVDSATYDVVVQPNTITAFFNTDNTQGCAPLTVNFTQYSIGVTNWYWTLQNGANPSTAQNPTFTYPAGTWTATLYGDNGCSYDTVSVVITVDPSPLVSFDVVPDSVCAGVPMQFLNTTPDVAGLDWDFGDTFTSTLSNPVHTYTENGTYPVTLTVESSVNDCSASLTIPVDVKVTPTAAFTPGPVSGCAPLQVTFTNDSDGDFAQWDFGDDNTSGNLNPTHTYTSAGTYLVQLISENLNGCADTAYTEVAAFPVPTAGFTLDPAQSCEQPVVVQFTNTSAGANSFNWAFDNGDTSTDVDPTATYATPGTNTITLTATNQYGCADEATGTFTTYPTPHASFSAETPGCVGYPVSFTNASTNSDAWWWSYGDGTQDNDEEPTHVYNEEGIYDVELIAYGAGGCTDTLEIPEAVVINPTPTAAFTWDTLQTLSNALQFVNLSEGAVDWEWIFGDGTHISTFEPLHMFPNGPANTYNVCLIAENRYGCPDTLCLPVPATSDPYVFVPNSFTPNGDGTNEVFVPFPVGFTTCRYLFYIFDRWGERIFTTDKPGDGWDGNLNGTPCKQDVYVWRLVIEGCTNEAERIKERDFIGHVTLLRGE